jgi:hypothetical protein
VLVALGKTGEQRPATRSFLPCTPSQQRRTHRRTSPARGLSGPHAGAMGGIVSENRGAESRGVECSSESRTHSVTGGPANSDTTTVRRPHPPAWGDRARAVGEVFSQRRRISHAPIQSPHVEGLDGPTSDEQFVAQLPAPASVPGQDSTGARSKKTPPCGRLRSRSTLTHPPTPRCHAEQGTRHRSRSLWTGIWGHGFQEGVIRCAAIRFPASLTLNLPEAFVDPKEKALALQGGLSGGALPHHLHGRREDQRLQPPQRPPARNHPRR